ncbi:tyrosine phosphatase-like protein [Pelagophyceae sp. CCMP2097]|nr:tyrosine phosphatase-like protein [Pelagophyceae sp. CCMP2097]
MGKAVHAYLVLYNSACLVAWGVALLRGVEAVASTGDLGNVWAALGAIVFAVQWAMSLEILHAAAGLVRSPFFVTAMQVTSRLWIVCVPFFDARAEEPCGVSRQVCVGLMVLSWAAVETIRYSFYLCALLGTMPYPVFWLRYSAFYLLYPTGITGEVLTAKAGLVCFKEIGLVGTVISAILCLYVPGSPFMYMNMVGNRKSALKKKFAPPPKPVRGTAFPCDAAGLRSTTVANKACISAALAACSDGGDDAAAKCLREKKYRFAYAHHYKQLVSLGAFSAENAVASAEAGLAWLRAHFEFVDADGATTKFGDAVRAGSKSTVSGRTLESAVVKGALKQAAVEYEVPYDGGWHPATPKAPAATISGSGLAQLCDKWVAAGVVERDAADAVNWTARFFASGGSLSDAHFVLIGAGSAMGPCSKLLELGAHVVAIDIPGAWGKGTKRPASGLWDRLIGLAERSSGSLTFPAARGEAGPLSERAGCDLMCEPREIAEWLEAVWMPTLPKNAKVCVGNYTYLDGELHVKLALCADVIIERVLAASKKLKFDTPAACAFLCTPTDAHLVPEAAHKAARNAHASRGTLASAAEGFVRFATMGAKLRPNWNIRKIPTAGGGEAYMCDGLSVAQGPNYALAKRMQHWRAVAAYAGGHTASSMVAPSTATLSVIHNKTFAWAYGGMPHFGFEVFKQETTNAVMCAVLVHDVLNAAGPKSPANAKKFGVDNALKLFSSEAVHGGLWRAPYTVDTLGECSALLYFLGLTKPYAAAFAGLTLVYVAGTLVL